MLLSFAFQMALMHPAIRQEFNNMQERSTTFDKNNEQAIWRELFKETIFKVVLDRPQYWVIDALDECDDSSKLFSLLPRIGSNYAVQFLITSRSLLGFERQFSSLGAQVATDIITAEDTMNDIRLFFHDNLDSLPANNNAERLQLMQNLVEKAAGCFLWARLVLHELRSVHSKAQTEKVIHELPPQMNSLYERILDNMSHNVRENQLAKALLIWALCAIRPMHTSELANAINIDEGINVMSLEKLVQDLGGQLLHVDKTGYVQVVHGTIRTFVTDHQDLESEFAISRMEGNLRLALTCLKYLSGDEMRPPRYRKSLKRPRKPKSAIVDYACIAFSEHLAVASAVHETLFLELEKFLTSNVLTWIEYIARTKKDLNHLTRAAKNLQIYLRRRSQYVPPLGATYQYIDKWVTDLARLITKFGQNLLQYPAAIYYLIPPLFPRNSAINQRLARFQYNLTVSGRGNDLWDDCISSIGFAKSRATAVATGDNAFAIGTGSGQIFLYWQTSCQEIIALENGESVRVLRFDNSHRLASAGARKIRLWDLNSHTQLWTQEIRDPPLILYFTPDDSFIIVSTWLSDVTILACSDGTIVREQSFANQWKPPRNIAISPDCRIIAFIYRGEAVRLCSLDDEHILGYYGGEDETIGMISGASPQQVIFNTNPAVELMVVSFRDGKMVLYETWSQRAVKTVQHDCHHMACSPDGRTIATSTGQDTIALWDFETLTMLYQINTRGMLSRELSFTACGTRLIELQIEEVKIWEPAVLIHRTSENPSISGSVALPALIVRDEHNDIIPITSTSNHPSRDIVFVGKDDGEVDMYSALTGELQSSLYSHRYFSFIRKIATSAGDVVVSEDANNTVIAQAFGEERSSISGSTEHLLYRRFDEPVQQLVLNSAGNRLLVSTTTTDYLWSRTEDHDQFTQTATLETPSRSIWRWMSSKRDPDTLTLFVDQSIRRFSWSNLAETASPRKVDIGTTDSAGSSGLTLKALATDMYGLHIIAEFAQKSGSKATERLVVWQDETASTEPVLLMSSKEIKHFLGMFRQRIVFLDHDLWVCSIDLTSLPAGRGSAGAIQEVVKKHFFVPLEFLGGNGGSMSSVSHKGCVLFPKDGELVVIRNGLDWYI
jgi:WD40 repeat protein